MSYTKGLRIHKGAPWIIDDENGSIVGCFETSGRSVLEDTDNALMFVAAGPMLEALEAVLVMWDRGPEPKKLDEALGWRANDELAREMARAAIALAKGESK